jgi:hypothetical protein
MKLQFSPQIFQKYLNIKFQVEVELFHADGQTDRQKDMKKLIVAFRNFAKAPKICHYNVRYSAFKPEGVITEKISK